MDLLRQKLASAIELRESEKQEEARQLLLELHSEDPADAQVNYRCAWIHDLLGLEKDAIPFYEKTVETGLADDNLKSALLDRGSTYRCIGEFQKTMETFQRALTLFPDSHKFNVFLAMAYYNVHEYAKAMELLLKSLVNTSIEEGILDHQRAICFYSDKLDQTW